MVQKAWRRNSTESLLQLTRKQHLDTHQLAQVDQQLRAVRDGGLAEAADELRVALDKGRACHPRQKLWMPQHVFQEPDVCTSKH